MFAPKDVIKATLCIGVVYKFEAPELITTNEPHYFIVVGIENDDNYLVLCTTQLDAKIEYLKRKGYDLNTLAYLTPNSENGLTDKSYINCNDYYTISADYLVSKLESKKLQLKGNLSAEEYKKITDAIGLSYVNDIPKNLLKFPS